MGIIIFCQYLGGAIWLTAGQTIFSNSLRQTLKYEAPGVDPNLILKSGARSVRELVSSSELPGVLRAYSTSINRVFYLGIALAGVSFCFSWGLGMKDIRKVEGKEKADTKDGSP